jgi:hypothetical protein
MNHTIALRCFPVIRNGVLLPCNQNWYSFVAKLDCEKSSIGFAAKPPPPCLFRQFPFNQNNSNMKSSTEDQNDDDKDNGEEQLGQQQREREAAEAEARMKQGGSDDDCYEVSRCCLQEQYDHYDCRCLEEFSCCKPISSSYYDVQLLHSIITIRQTNIFQTPPRPTSSSGKTNEMNRDLLHENR